MGEEKESKLLSAEVEKLVRIIARLITLIIIIIMRMTQSSAILTNRELFLRSKWNEWMIMTERLCNVAFGDAGWLFMN